ncbi:MAG: tRNA (adenosine(37)-N6)-threonylcarbamoyltransferase complex ATPase subunit type 1 TsaE [Firmicutes bacterium]|nr:tRNA (adenosine(37)-N6)-threonylcarbamoyltransferase complex ATPase subunit type 1 TsaE [Bacillota bacterium]
MITIKTASEHETRNIGFLLGSVLKKGDIVCLEGELGVGKTVFVKGVASALGVEEYVTSPTFIIVNEYNGRLPVYHFDVYRISDPQDMYEIGFEEYIYGDGIVVVEWADLIKEILPDELIWVRIEKNNINKKNNAGEKDVLMVEEGRIIHIDFIGERYRKYMDCLVSNMGKEVGKG